MYNVTKSCFNVLAFFLAASAAHAESLTIACASNGDTVCDSTLPARYCQGKRLLPHQDVSFRLSPRANGSATASVQYGYILGPYQDDVVKTNSETAIRSHLAYSAAGIAFDFDPDSQTASLHVMIGYDWIFLDNLACHAPRAWR
jgi:hypothetical protein